MCTRIVGERSGGIYFADRNVLYGRGRKEVEWDQLVVRIGRSDGQPVQGGGAVPVSQSAHNQLSGTGNGDSRYFFNPILYVRYTFESHLLGSHVLDGKRCFLSFLQQSLFTFQVLAGHYGDGIQRLCIHFQFEVQCRIGFYLHFIHPERFISYVFHLEGIGAVVQCKGVITV